MRPDWEIEAQEEELRRQRELANRHAVARAEDEAAPAAVPTGEDLPWHLRLGALVMRVVDPGREAREAQGVFPPASAEGIPWRRFSWLIILIAFIAIAALFMHTCVVPKAKRGAEEVQRAQLEALQRQAEVQAELERVQRELQAAEAEEPPPPFSP